MITLEEAKAQGLVIVGTEPYPDFVISSRADKFSLKNSWLDIEIQAIVNKKLKINKYGNCLNHITITTLLLPPYDGMGVNWQERKYFSRKEKHFYMDLRISDYEGFCAANSTEAIEMLRVEILRGIEKFLTKVKGFDAKQLYKDIETVFATHLLC